MNFTNVLRNKMNLNHSTTACRVGAMAWTGYVCGNQGRRFDCRGEASYGEIQP